MTSPQSSNTVPRAPEHPPLATNRPLWQTVRWVGRRSSPPVPPSNRVRMQLRSMVSIPLALSLFGCQNFGVPPTETELVLRYPPGAVAELPHRNPGDQVLVVAKVTDPKGHPVSGVEVIWDEGTGAPGIRAVSDTAGQAGTVWVLRALPNGVFSTMRSIRAYVPGAENNPLEYRIEVTTCTTCPTNPPGGN